MSVRGWAGLNGHRTPSLARPPGRTPADPDAVAITPADPSRWADYFAVAATARLRVSQRRRLRDAARTGMVLVVLAALLNCIWLVPFHPDAIVLLVGLNGAVALAATLAYLWITRQGRRYPERSVLAVLGFIDVATVTLGVFHPALGLVAAGYLFLLAIRQNRPPTIGLKPAT